MTVVEGEAETVAVTLLVAVSDNDAVKLVLEEADIEMESVIDVLALAVKVAVVLAVTLPVPLTDNDAVELVLEEADIELESLAEKLAESERKLKVAVEALRKVEASGNQEHQWKIAERALAEISRGEP